MRKFVWRLGCLACAVMAVPAMAETVKVNDTGISPRIDGFTLVRSPYLQDVSGVEAGVNHFTNIDGSAWSGSFNAFCIEMQYLQSSPHTYEVKALTQAPYPAGPQAGGAAMTADKADSLSELWGGFYNNITDNKTAAAFQLAVWEIVYESSGTWDVGSGGTFAVSGDAGAMQQANDWLRLLKSNEYPHAHLVALSSGGDQDMITAVPLPAAVWMGMALLGGIGGVGAIRRRFQKA